MQPLGSYGFLNFRKVGAGRKGCISICN